MLVGKPPKTLVDMRKDAEIKVLNEEKGKVCIFVQSVISKLV